MNNPVNMVDPLGLTFWSSFGHGLVVGAVTGTAIVGVAGGAVWLGVPLAVVTGSLFVAGAAGGVIAGYSIITNPSPDNVGYNVGALAGGAIVGGVTGRGLASKLSPPENQPLPGWPAWSLKRDYEQMWRVGGPARTRIPLAILGDFCKAMKTGPNPPSALGATATAGAGLADASRR